MNNLKRLLALVLVMSMLLTVAPFSAFATESTDPTGETTGPAADAPESTDPTGEAAETAAEDGVAVAAAEATAPTTNLTTTGSPFQKGTGGSNSFRIPALVTLSDGTLVAAADARWNTTYDGGGLDTMVAISADKGATWTHSFANYLGDNGNEYNGASSCFIDPSLAVYTTDENNDGVGEDTIFMLCDLYPNGVALNGSKETTPGYSTGFDASGNLKLTTAAPGTYTDSDFTHYLDGDKIYANNGTVVSGLTVDAYFNVTGTYNGAAVDSNLFFADSPFHVARTGFLYLTKGTYNSTDKTISWSAPTLLNLKTTGEMVCLVGPGRGLVTSEGVIIFPVYSYAGESSKYTGLIYSDDNGTTWNRTVTFSQIISSEATMLELDNGDIRVFFRNDLSNLVYADYKLGTNGMSDGWWGTYVNTGVACNSDTELSAITYSYGVVDGGVEKNVVFVSAPGGPSSLNGTNDNNGAYRSSGKIFMGLIDPEDYTMTWKSNSLAVTPVAANAFSGSTFTAAQGFFGYSCLTQKYESGDIAILYEDNQFGWGAASDGSNYYTMAFKTYTQGDLEEAFGVTFTGNTDVEVDGSDSTVETVTLKVGETVNKTIDGVTLNGEKEDTYAKVTWTGSTTGATYATATLGSSTAFNGATIDVADCLYTFTETSDGVWSITGTDENGATVYLYPGNGISGGTAPGYPHTTTPPTGLEVYVTAGGETGSFYISSNLNVWNNGKITYLNFTRNAYRWNRNESVDATNCSLYLYREAVAGETSSNEIPGYVKVTSLDDVSSGGKYLITAPGTDGKTYVAYPSTSEDSLYSQIAKVTGNTATSDTATDESTTVTITGKAAGNTQVEVGDVTYNITVTADAPTVTNTVDVNIEVGKTSQVYTNTTGSDIVKNTDSTIATMTVNKVAGQEASYTVASDLESGAQYLITFGNSIVTSNTSTNGYGGNWTSASGLLMTTNTANQEQYLWTVTKSGDGYTFMNANGKYLNVATQNNSVTLSDTPVVLSVIDNGSTFTIHNNNYCLNNFGGANAFASCWSGTTDGNAAWTLKKYTPAVEASTTVSFTGVKAGTTTAIVGTTQYNITVTAPYETTKTVDVAIPVNGKYTYTHHEGDLTIYAEPNAGVAAMTVGKQLTSVTAIESGKQYLIVNKATGDILTDTAVTVSGDWADKPGLDTTGTASPDSTELWTITGADGKYTVVQGSNYLSVAGFEAYAGTTHQPTLTLNYVEGSGWTIYDNTTWASLSGHNQANYYLSDNVGNNYTGGALGTSDASNAYIYWDIYEIIPAVEFTGVAVGETVAIVGSTRYNITVSQYTIVDIELEIGEDFTYTDTTGNHTENVPQEPDGTKATMTLTSTPNATQEKLVAVTAKTFETGKLYVIENVRTANPNHGAYQPNDSVLTATEVVGGATGLDMNGPLDVATSQKWSFTPSDNMYFVKANGEYIHIDANNATMETAAQSLSFEYVDGSGWLIYYNVDGNNTSDDGDYFLSDVYGTGSGEAFGYTTKGDDGNYWNIYEVVEETTTEATKVTFHGVAEGTTTAIVGNTQYNITVVPQEVDDEVENTATGIWTVDPEVQRNEYYSIVAGKHKDLYTDDSWKQYETARQAAYKKLIEVTNAEYTSKAAADEALAELTELVNKLDEAAKKLVGATTISVRYHLDTTDGTLLDTKEYKIASTETSVTLPDTIVVNNIAYKVSTTTLERQGAETSYDVVVTEIGKLGGGFVASADITAGTHNGHTQVADLVDDNGANPKKITEMTLTTGISYDVDLAIEMKDGYTVKWVSDNTSVATVDENGLVTAEGEGTANITATVTDADGNIVEVNSMPVTVFPKGTDDRNTAIYIEEVSNTTVWCVVNGDTQNYAFECIEGELIYGQFDTTVSDGTKTTAMAFFGDPDEAHALVYMKSTGSDDHYFLLHDDDGNLYDGTVTANKNYYVSGQTEGAGYWQAVGLSGNQTGTNTPGWSIIKDMVQWAINQGCDGGLGFTRRQSEGDIGSNLRFKSDPMPRIEKVVDGVLPVDGKYANYRRYVENMTAAVHEQVYFKITIIQEVPTEWTDTAETIGAITYSGAMVTDTVLPGAYLYTKELDQADGTWDGNIAEASRTQKDDVTDKLNKAWTAEEKAAGMRTFEYYLRYEIQESDIPKFWIDNIANLAYNYGSKYSAGAQAAAADAEARISVVGSAIDNVVIDFGQSFTYKGHDFTSITDGKTYTFEGLTNVHLKGAYVDGEYDVDGNYNEGVVDGVDTLVSGAKATYGDVKVYRRATGEKDDKGNTEYIYTVVYTPTSILQAPDAVVIYGLGENDQTKVINGFMVYPATTVYYEEGFMLNENSTWDNSAAKKATGFQTFELLGASQFNEHGELTHKVSNKKHAYGYDPIYDDGKAADESSYISATDVGQSTAFTFTGTGFELYANSKISTGKVSAKVVNSEGKVVKMYIVNTVASEGYTGVTDGQDTILDSLPIVAVKNLEHDTYTVTLSKVVANSGTVYIDGVRILNTVEDSSVFTIDQEDNPEFHHLRDYVLNAVNINEDTSVDYPTMYDQVYAMLGADATAFIVSAEDPYADVDGETTVYLTTTVKTIETTQKYTDGTYSVTTRVDTTVEEYRDAARTELSKTKVNTEVEVVCYEADGNKTEFDVNSKVANGNPTSTVTETTNYSEMQVTTAQDLLDNGPKNEIYLHQNEALVFHVKTSRVMQLGLKAPQGTASYKITGATNDSISGTLNTSVDMFYELDNEIGTETEYTITVKNTGSTILSVTDLKICDDPNAAFVALTQEDVENALVNMGYGDPCATGHSYDAVVTEPTCTEQGYTTYTCSVCGDTYVGDETETLGHSYDAVVTEPTCTEAGYTTYTCSVCGDTYVGDETEALGHSHEAVVTDPTCTEQGYTTYTCHCGDTFVDDYVDATGHDYSNGSCNDCGAKDPNAGSSGTVGQIISQIIGWIIGLIKP